MDGVNLWESAPNGILTLLQAFPATNVFALWLDPSRPHLLAVTSFRNWPAPYVLSSFLDDNGNVITTTNFYVESDPAWFVYCPSNAPNIALFATTNGLLLCGWCASNLTVQASSDRLTWTNWQAVTNPGPWTLGVDGSQGTMFWRSRQ